MTTFEGLLGATAMAALMTGSALAQGTPPQEQTGTAEQPMTRSDAGGTQAQPMPKGEGAQDAQTADSGSGSGSAQPMQQGQDAQTAQGASASGGDEAMPQGEGRQTADSGSGDGQVVLEGQTGEGGQMTVDASQGGSGGTASPSGQAQEQMAALEVESQPVQDVTVKIDLASMPEAGFVAIHPVKGDQLSANAIGHAAVPAGESGGLTVKLDRQVAENTPLVAILHRDTGETGTYEFGSGALDEDAPEFIGSRMIAVPFEVLPLDASADARPSSGTMTTRPPRDSGRTSALARPARGEPKGPAPRGAGPILRPAPRGVARRGRLRPSRARCGAPIRSRWCGAAAG